MNNQILLSLCIPTYGVIEWIMPVIESIYEQKCDETKFEVVITDNGENSKLEEALKQFKHANLYYYKTTSKGFVNIIEAFKKCNGIFCKMINHRSKLLPGSICEIIKLVEKYKDTKPVMYFSNNAINVPTICECKNIDEFCYKLSYYSSWSAGVGLWDIDIKNIDRTKINNMFPNMSLLFDLRQQSKYIIWNEAFNVQPSDKGKGGYDLFYTFGVIYLNEMHRLLKERRIKQKTFDKIRHDLLRFLSSWYRDEYLSPYTIHNFIIKDVKKSLSVYYNELEYLYFLLLALSRVPKMYLRCSIKLHRNIFSLIYDRTVNGIIIHDTK